MMLRGAFFTAVAAVMTLTGVNRPDAVPSSPDLTGIAHVAIRVAELEQSRAFFRKLGFEEAFAMEKGGAPTEAFFKVNDRQFIELYPRRDASAAVGFMHVCFEAADVSAVYQNYVDRGLTPSAVKRAGAGNLLFTLQGPEQPGSPSDLRGAATQNIEYTQYMPGSRHTLDRGQHLGSDRIAERIAAVGIPFAVPATAEAFYVDKLSFRRDARTWKRGLSALTLPGSSDQQIEFLPDTQKAASNSLSFQLTFSVSDLHRTWTRLRTLGIVAEKSGKSLVIRDPDGDIVVFEQAAH